MKTQAHRCVAAAKAPRPTERRSREGKSCPRYQENRPVPRMGPAFSLPFNPRHAPLDKALIRTAGLSRSIIPLVDVALYANDLHRAPVFDKVVRLLFSQELYHARVEFRFDLLVFLLHPLPIPFRAIGQLDVDEARILKHRLVFRKRLH